MEMAYAMLRMEPASSNLQLSPAGTPEHQVHPHGNPFRTLPRAAWRETRLKEAKRQPLAGTAFSETAEMPRPSLCSEHMQNHCAVGSQSVSV
eukprot:1022658-Prymnesium_polylepis.1